MNCYLKLLQSLQRFKGSIFGFNYSILGFNDLTLGFNYLILGFNDSILGFNDSILGYKDSNLISATHVIHLSDLRSIDSQLIDQMNVFHELGSQCTSSAANSDITFYFLLKIYKPFPIITSGRFAALKTAKACWMAFGSAIAIGGAKHGGITLEQKKEPIF